MLASIKEMRKTSNFVVEASDFSPRLKSLSFAISTGRGIYSNGYRLNRRGPLNEFGTTMQLISEHSSLPFSGPGKENLINQNAGAELR